MSVKHEIRRFLWTLGCDITRYAPESHPVARMQHLLTSYDIDVVLDIGANTGQFAEILRHDFGYKNRIISFEPLGSAFASLKAKADRDPLWDSLNIALGDVDGEREINIAGNSYSSSLLEMLPAHLKSAPESVYKGKESIEIKKLDSLFDGLCSKADNIFMKIDTQGFEDKVLKGAENSLAKINTVQMEMSLVPLYKGELLFNELYNLMSAKGYHLVAIIPIFIDKDSGQVLQVDGVFHRFE